MERQNPAYPEAPKRANANRLDQYEPTPYERQLPWICSHTRELRAWCGSVRVSVGVCASQNDVRYARPKYFLDVCKSALPASILDDVMKQGCNGLVLITAFLENNRRHCQ